METIEGIGKAVANSAQKGASDIGSDVVEAITGNAKPLPQQQKQQINKQQAQNLARINQQIADIRKKKEETYKKVEEKKDEKQEEKKFEKKKKENFLMKMIKSRKGTKEGMQRASG